MRDLFIIIVGISTVLSFFMMLYFMVSIGRTFRKNEAGRNNAPFKAIAWRIIFSSFWCGLSFGLLTVILTNPSSNLAALLSMIIRNLFNILLFGIFSLVFFYGMFLLVYAYLGIILNAQTKE